MDQQFRWVTARNIPCFLFLLHVMSAGWNIQGLVSHIHGNSTRMVWTAGSWLPGNNCGYMSGAQDLAVGWVPWLSSVWTLSHPVPFSPNLVFPYGVSSSGLPWLNRSWALRKREQKCQSSYWHSIHYALESSPKEVYKSLQNHLLSLLLNVGPQIAQTIIVNILYNLALTNKELEFHSEIPQYAPRLWDSSMTASER